MGLAHRAHHDAPAHDHVGHHRRTGVRRALGPGVSGAWQHPGQDGLSSLHWTHWTDPLDIDNHWRFIGATQVQGHGGPWTLAIEFNGWMGESDEYMSPASAGTQVLSHYQNASGRTSFNWWEDDELRTTFEFPTAAELLANSSYTCGYFGELPAVYRNDGQVSVRPLRPRPPGLDQES
ncbi:DUF6461 domain-containing protein [Streptomyces niveus]|uniref:DUF6461 domain-containing protein n=1 Tax=Streptomyces niveus TaxID=193462 RepID=UPI0036516EDB